MGTWASRVVFDGSHIPAIEAPRVLRKWEIPFIGDALNTLNIPILVVGATNNPQFPETTFTLNT